MSQENKNVKVGEIRPSQVLTTFGIGAIIDLPNISVMVMGLEDWEPFLQDASEIKEERLLHSVRQLLGAQVRTLRSAPIIPDTDGFSAGPFDPSSQVGIPVAPFPRWMVCPYCRRLAPLSSGLFKLEPHLFRPDLVRYCHGNCNKKGKPPTAVPARFIVACRNGHLDDFPWVKFVHKTDKTTCKWSLRLYEFGASGEAADIEVRCETCGASRRMSDAFRRDDNGLGPCRGRRPHLVDYVEGGCKDIDGSDMRQVAMLQGASNSWFAIMLSALAIPKAVDPLSQLIEDQWTTLRQVQSQQNIQLLRSLPQTPLRDLAAYTDDQIWGAVQEKLSNYEVDDNDDGIDADLKTPEWQVFSNPHSVQRTRDFQLRVAKPPKRYAEYFDKIVLAERLREVRGLVGFTRIESPGDSDDPTDIPALRQVPLSRKSPRWIPASEIRGEGIFFHFSEDKIQEWLKSKGISEHEGVFSEAHRRWRMARGLEPVQDHDPGMRFVLLHSFAHALIRQLAVECGYTAASLRERIYSRAPGSDEPAMAGVLIYTAAPDSEGTLGGLVSLGEPHTLERHLDQALDAMRLCASDPLCAEHHPYRDGTTLHGASCHACLFAPETSCERGNKYLDRTVLVPTVDQDKLAFFDVSGETIDEEPSDDNVGEDSSGSMEDATSGQLNLYDLVDHGVPDAAEVSIRLPDDMSKELGLSANVATFQIVVEQSAKPKKNDVVIVIRDQMRRGDEKVRIACGKLWWQRQTSVDSGEASVAVMIRASGTPVRFTLTDSEWEKFRPVAVLKQ
jgi:hypothetical protein